MLVEWFNVEIMFEVMVWFKLNGLLIVMLKLFMCNLFELVNFNVVKFFGFLICINVMLDCGFVFINFVLNFWLLFNWIVILFVFLIMWLFVMI